MNNNKIGIVFLTLFIFIVSVFGIYIAGKAFWSFITNNSHSELTVAIIAGCFTILLSVVSLALGKYYEKKREIEQVIRQKKIPLYQDLITYFMSYMLNKEEVEEVKQANLVRFLQDKTPELIIWASSDVIAEWGNFKSSAGRYAEGEISPHHILFIFENILLAIRKDIGHNNTKLDKGDILRLFITDIDLVLKNKN